jgi:CBS domain-containing protein
MEEIIDKRSIIATEYKSIHEEDRLSKAIVLFDDKTNALIVLDSRDKYSGVLTERKLLRSTINPEEAKVKRFMSDAPKITKETDVQECAKLMINSSIIILPVFEREKLIGIVTDTSLLESDVFKKFNNEKVSKFMTTSVKTATPENRVSVILNKFKEENLSRMPVIENGKVVGILTLHDIIKKVAQRKKLPAYGFILAEKDTVLDWAIESLMTKNPVTVGENTTIVAVIEKMIQNDISSIMVADNKNRLQGIITRKDLLALIAKEEEKGPIISINSNVQDLDRFQIKEIIKDFIKQYPNKLRHANFNIYLRTHKENLKGQDLIHTKMKVILPIGKFIADGEDWGAEYSVKDCLQKIEKQIIRKYDIQKDKRETWRRKNRNIK